MSAERTGLAALTVWLLPGAPVPALRNLKQEMQQRERSFPAGDDSPALLHWPSLLEILHSTSCALSVHKVNKPWEPNHTPP